MRTPTLDALAGATARIDGREIVLFGGCNYLGLARHPRVLAAAEGAIERFGLSVSASRETTGNTALHRDLEAAVAGFCRLEAGLLVPDGYIANLAAVQSLAAMGVTDAVIDARGHASLRDAAQAAGLRISLYRHLDAQDAASVIAVCEGPAVVMTDSVFAADGAIAPLKELAALLRDSDRLLADDCHGFCVLGPGGEGAARHADLDDTRLIVTTTLAKGLGCGGGVVMGEADFVREVRSTSTAYMCTTPVSPVLASAGLAALAVLRDDPDLIATMRRNAGRVSAILAASGLDAGESAVPIFAFAFGDDGDMERLHRAAWDSGVWMPLVRYPGGPMPTYFRLAVSASHSEGQIKRLQSVLEAAFRANQPGATR
ncbi:MAG: pyridoxal phosphate-dependent aminotransferase family protein [Planctomycetota bacterium]